ncbi:MAG: PBP1A family penicillin-binding protein [Candidatus Wolfebacteria bacterium]|nr:PBP1A family penicillin-binding protein [Candidatus Wolfebacteria bacterium]
MKIFGLILLAAFGLALLGLATLAQMARELPSPEQFTSRQVNQSTKIYDRTGQVLLYEVHGDEKRTVVPPDQIPDYAKKATLAIEDQTFYNHPAFDWRGIARAAYTNIIRGNLSQGGSTITQQLAKNAFLSSDKTFTRKIKELILANWIEKTYSKDQILNLYLNQIPYGSNAYGIEAASQTYFGKSAKDISIAEAATLAAMIQAPSHYSPWGPNRKELLARKDYALDQMNKLGFITDARKKSAEKEDLKFQPQSIGNIKAPHFVMMAREYLIDKYGEDEVQNGGLKVITTLDYNLQQIAEKTIKEGADRNSAAYNGKNASLVAQDAKTGQILALVGSKDYFGESEPAGCEKTPNGCQFEGNFDVATQGLRQPGSSFKPFAYVTAFKEGYSPNTMVFDLPTEFSTYSAVCPITNIDYKSDNTLCFHPENYDHIFRGPINLRNALAQSINIPSVKTLYLAGISNSINMAASLGITTLADPNRYGLSLVLGGGEVKLVDMVEAYSVFAQDGVKHDQTFILSVSGSDNQVLEKYSDAANQVIDPQYPRLINDILSDVDARSGLFSSSLELTTFPDREVAMKTGTTNNYRDAWTIGYTPDFVVGVWAGNNNNQPMQKQAGSILAAVPIWHAFLEKAFKIYSTASTFTKPDPIPYTDKPMLDGQYVYNSQVHNILRYIDRNNPQGALPQNPAQDSQYLNWELPVQIWAGTQNFTQNIAPQSSSTQPG